MIYLLYEKYYDEYGDFCACNVYPYRLYEGVVQRLVDETGKTTAQVEDELSSGDGIVKSGNWEYSVEETEVL